MFTPKTRISHLWWIGVVVVVSIGLFLTFALLRSSDERLPTHVGGWPIAQDSSIVSLTRKSTDTALPLAQSVEEAIESIRSLDGVVRSTDRAGALELLKALATTHPNIDIRVLAASRYAQAARQSQNEQELQDLLETCLPLWDSIAKDPSIWRSQVVAHSPIHVLGNDLALTLLLNRNDPNTAVRVYEPVWEMRDHLPLEALANATQNFASILIASKQNQRAADVVWSTLTDGDSGQDTSNFTSSLADRFVSVAMAGDVVLSESQVQTIQAWLERSDIDTTSLAVLVSETHSRNGRSTEAVESAFSAYNRLRNRDATGSSPPDAIATQWEEHLLSRMQSGGAVARPDIELFALNEMLKRPEYSQSTSAFESRVRELTTILNPLPSK